MITQISDYTSLADQLKRENPELSTYEAFTLAIQIQRNEILENAFVVARDSKDYPSALEDIAISLKEIRREGIEINN